MKILKQTIINILFSIVLAIFLTIVSVLFIYPLIIKLCNMDDFDGYWLLIIMQSLQLSTIIFMGKYLNNKITDNNKR